MHILDEWINRIGITRKEGLAISFLIFVFATGSGVRFLMNRLPSYDPEYYRESDSLFAALSEGAPGAGRIVSVTPSGPVRLVVDGDTFEADERGRWPPEAGDTAGMYAGPKLYARLTDPDSVPPMNLNRATERQLRQVRGIGPVLADRILAHRMEHGDFTEVEELVEVSGIGPRTLERVRPYFFVEEDSAASDSSASAGPVCEGRSPSGPSPARGDTACASLGAASQVDALSPEPSL
jgi:competence protein ComEA